jgi:hypothetical protein
MTRRLGMQASSTLLTPWPTLRLRPILWSKWHVRAVALAIGVGALITASVFTAADASPQTYCTPTMPYPPYGAVCTGGWGNYCTLGLACSPVPGMPGTQNPNGYTPTTGGNW